MPSLAEMLAAQKAAKDAASATLPSSDSPTDSTKPNPLSGVSHAQPNPAPATDQVADDGARSNPLRPTGGSDGDGRADAESAPATESAVRVNPLAPANPLKRNPLLGGTGPVGTPSGTQPAARPNPLLGGSIANLRAGADESEPDPAGGSADDAAVGEALDSESAEPESAVSAGGDRDGGLGQDDGNGAADDSGTPAPARLTLESLSATTIAGGKETPEQLRERIRKEFPDHVPADAPFREIPEDAPESLVNFLSVLDGIYDRLLDPDLFGKMVRVIMMELQENPQYMQQVTDHDKARLMEGLRASMGEIRQVKAEKSEKRRKSTKAVASEQKLAVANKVAGRLANLGIG